jgi:type II secretory pathway component PulM
MPALRPRERRLLILAGLIAIGVAGYLYVVEPLIEAHASTRELVVARSALLVRQERLVARSEAYGKELTELRAEIDRRESRAVGDDRAERIHPGIPRIQHAALTQRRARGADRGLR